ncbi:hypothetical protein HOY80DRAFT_316604 [Tuber brumale]|nr:hypothetical protein HOY80DRAFT_316604 [Tuber brumale]
MVGGNKSSITLVVKRCISSSWTGTRRLSPPTNRFGKRLPSSLKRPRFLNTWLGGVFCTYVATLRRRKMTRTLISEFIGLLYSFTKLQKIYGRTMTIIPGTVPVYDLNTPHLISLWIKVFPVEGCGFKTKITKTSKYKRCSSPSSLPKHLNVIRLSPVQYSR